MKNRKAIFATAISAIALFFGGCSSIDVSKDSFESISARAIDITNMSTKEFKEMLLVRMHSDNPYDTRVAKAIIGNEPERILLLTKLGKKLTHAEEVDFFRKEFESVYSAQMSKFSNKETIFKSRLDFSIPLSKIPEKGFDKDSLEIRSNFIQHLALTYAQKNGEHIDITLVELNQVNHFPLFRSFEVDDLWPKVRLPISRQKLEDLMTNAVQKSGKDATVYLKGEVTTLFNITCRDTGNGLCRVNTIASNVKAFSATAH